MRVVKNTASTLVLSNLKEVRRRRKASLFLLVINLLIIAGCFWFLPIFNGNTTRAIFIGFVLLLLLPGILIIRFNTGESDYFLISTYKDKITHKRRMLFSGKSYVANYSLKNVIFISICRNSFNSDDGKDYQLTLHFHSQNYKNKNKNKNKKNKYLNLGYFETKEQSLKLGKTISQFLKIPLKLR